MSTFDAFSYSTRAADGVSRHKGARVQISPSSELSEIIVMLALGVNWTACASPRMWVIGVLVYLQFS